MIRCGAFAVYLRRNSSLQSDTGRRALHGIEDIQPRLGPYGEKVLYIGSIHGQQAEKIRDAPYLGQTHHAPATQEQCLVCFPPQCFRPGGSPTPGACAADPKHGP